MSLSRTVVDAVRIARREMGDLVKLTVLKVNTGQIYEGGKYENTYDPQNVEVVVDKFTFHEQQLEDYQQTDVKLLIFNPNNDLKPSRKDLIVWDEKDIPIIRADPIYVGGYIPAWTVVLRQ